THILHPLFILSMHTSPTDIFSLSLHDALPIYNTVSILLMDNSTDPTTIILGLATAAVIYIGGEYLVWKWQKTFQSRKAQAKGKRSEEHTSELQSRFDLVCRLLLEKKNNKTQHT